MSQPTVEIIPLRPAFRADAPTALDVLVKVTPPQPERRPDRPVLNLALVLDRSGSMAGHKKIDYAREAAAFAVGQLLAEDRVSVTIFDDHVEAVVPSTPAEDKARIAELIRGVQPRGSTALHGGWLAGAEQARGHLVPGGLNRVLLLSDGLANVGETNPDAIGTDVHRLAREGVSTTTLGLGDDYNERLMEAMARSGDGNYYHIESPVQLADIFQTELQGLAATAGYAVTLAVEPQEGVTVAEVLTELNTDAQGRLQLPNLVAGMPVLVLLRLHIVSTAQEYEVCRFRLAWDAPNQAGRQELTAALCLPAVPAAVWESVGANIEVQERSALLRIARLKKVANERLGRGEVEEARRLLAEMRQVLAGAPNTPEVQREAQALAELDAFAESGAWMKMQKHSHYQAYRRHQSKPLSFRERAGCHAGSGLITGLFALALPRG